nr:unknown [Darna trima granulovirus]
MKRSWANWIVGNYECSEKEKRLRNLLITNSGLKLQNGKWLDKRIDLNQLDTEELLVKVLKVLHDERYKEESLDVNRKLSIAKEARRFINKRPNFNNVNSVKEFILQLSRLIAVCSPDLQYLVQDIVILSHKYGLSAKGVDNEKLQKKLDKTRTKLQECNKKLNLLMNSNSENDTVINLQLIDETQETLNETNTNFDNENVETNTNANDTIMAIDEIPLEYTPINTTNNLTTNNAIPLSDSTNNTIPLGYTSNVNYTTIINPPSLPPNNDVNNSLFPKRKRRHRQQQENVDDEAESIIVIPSDNAAYDSDSSQITNAIDNIENESRQQSTNVANNIITDENSTNENQQTDAPIRQQQNLKCEMKNRRLKLKIQELYKKIRDFRKVEKENYIKFTNLNNEYTNYKNQYNIVNEKLENTQIELNETNNRMRDEITKLGQLANEKSQIENELYAARDQLQIYETDLFSKTTELQTRTFDLDKCNERLNTLEIQLGSYKDQLKTYHDDNYKINDLESQLFLCNEQLKKTQNRLEQRTNELKQQNINERIRERQKANIKKSKELKLDTKLYEDTIQQLENENADYKTRLQTSVQKYDNLQEILSLDFNKQKDALVQQYKKNEQVWKRVLIFLLSIATKSLSVKDAQLLYSQIYNLPEIADLQNTELDVNTLQDVDLQDISLNFEEMFEDDEFTLLSPNAAILNELDPEHNQLYNNTVLNVLQSNYITDMFTKTFGVNMIDKYKIDTVFSKLNEFFNKLFKLIDYSKNNNLTLIDNIGNSLQKLQSTIDSYNDTISDVMRERDASINSYKKECLNNNDTIQLKFENRIEELNSRIELETKVITEYHDMFVSIKSLLTTIASISNNYVTIESQITLTHIENAIKQLYDIDYDYTPLASENQMVEELNQSPSLKAYKRRNEESITPLRRSKRLADRARLELLKAGDDEENSLVNIPS